MRWVVRPISLQHFEEMLGDGEGRITDINAFFILAAVVWTLWKSRNDWVFNNNNLIKCWSCSKFTARYRPGF
jgi:hypothetical protein